MTSVSRARPLPAVLLSVAGLAVWAGHFTAIYAISALACERRLVDAHLAGLPWIPVMVGIATLVALALLAIMLRPAWRGLRPWCTDAGEAEPGFTRWLACATAALAGLGIVFQALPVVVLPGCG